MSSVSSRFAQRLTRTLKVGGTAAPLFTQAEIDDWYGLNKSSIKKLGNNYVISAADFVSVVTDSVDGLSSAQDAAINTSLKDFGREIKIGTTTESALIVLRLVQLPGLVADNGGNLEADKTGYVVVANNTTDAVTAAGGDSLLVLVSRV